LAGLAEIEHRVAQLLHFPPVRRLERRRHEKDAGDARIALREAETFDKAAHGGRVTRNQLSDDVIGHRLLQLAAGTKDERGIVLDRRSAGDPAGDPAYAETGSEYAKRSVGK